MELAGKYQGVAQLLVPNIKVSSLKISKAKPKAGCSCQDKNK
jgi:hypothetical protein